MTVGAHDTYTDIAKQDWRKGFRIYIQSEDLYVGHTISCMIRMSEKMLLSLHEEIVKIRQLLELMARDRLEREIGNILSTKERKMVWALSDGLNDTKTIAEKAGVSQRAVQVTLKDLHNAGLLTVERRGFPKRRFDYLVSEQSYEHEEQRT